MVMADGYSKSDKAEKHNRIVRVAAKAIAERVSKASRVPM